MGGLDEGGGGSGEGPMCARATFAVTRIRHASVTNSVSSGRLSAASLASAQL